jgi:hypothetical protein
MSSRVFQAKTGHTAQNPQLCGLTGTPVQRDDWIMYLVCHGADARPQYQIKVVAEREVEKEIYDRRKRRKVKKTVTERDYGMAGRQFRTVYDGKRKNPQTGKREKIFIWQEHVGIDADGEPMWRTVKCWSHIVHAEAADRLGYEVREDENGEWAKTEAYDGDRAVGSEHNVEEEEDNAMVTLARAALSDEEAGLVPPETEVEQIIREENEAISEAMSAEMEAEAKFLDERDAEALGLTLEQYRKLVSEHG